MKQPKTIISEQQFYDALTLKLSSITNLTDYKCVIGKGRSGAIASVYTSHLLGIPFLPYGEFIPEKLRPVLIVDTASLSGDTIRRTLADYHYANPLSIAVYKEPPRVRFWYEHDCRVTNDN